MHNNKDSRFTSPLLSWSSCNANYACSRSQRIPIMAIVTNVSCDAGTALISAVSLRTRIYRAVSLIRQMKRRDRGPRDMKRYQKTSVRTCPRRGDLQIGGTFIIHGKAAQRTLLRCCDSNEQPVRPRVNGGRLAIWRLFLKVPS